MTAEEIAKALEHVRRAAETHGTDLDEVSLELVTAFTALKRAEKKLNQPQQNERGAA